MLYKRHGDTVFRYAWHLLGRREDAEDATQATFLAVHGALAGGTAVLESSAWVLRIARNECMGRLRQTARRPAVRSLDDGFDPPAAGGVERSAELRDEVRTARETLGGLPVPEREAFVLREWLGFEASEAALALGMTAGDVDGLAARARRRLVIAVGGLEPAVGCSGTRAALETGSLDRAAKVHLLRCPVCRGVRRALRPPESGARPAVAERLSAVIPGFATSGGGILAALMAKAATAPVLAKTAAIVAAAVATGGAVEQAIVREYPAHHRAHGGQAQAAPVPASGGHAAPILATSAGGARVTPSRSVHVSSSLAGVTARGAAAQPISAHGSRAGEDSHGRSSGRDDAGGGHSGSANAGSGKGDDRSSGRDDSGASVSGKHSSHDGNTSSEEGTGTGTGTGTGDRHGTSSESSGGRDDSGDHSGEAESGKDSTVTTTPTAGATSGGGDSSVSGKDAAETSGVSESHSGDGETPPVTTGD